MSWEWVTPQATALAVTKQQADAQVAVAREERQQRRLEEAYLEMMAAVTSVYYWVFTVYPELTQTPEQYTMPPLPELSDNARKEALWTAYWSPRVEQLMEAWQVAVRRLQAHGMRIGLARATEASGHESALDVARLQVELPSRKREVIDADRRVREQVRLELLGRHDGQAEEASGNSPSPS